jgi:hypothetical protein
LQSTLFIIILSIYLFSFNTTPSPLSGTIYHPLTGLYSTLAADSTPLLQETYQEHCIDNNKTEQTQRATHRYGVQASSEEGEWIVPVRLAVGLLYWVGAIFGVLLGGNVVLAFL